MSKAISIKNVSKTYQNGFKALDRIDLDIEYGEIFALLGPNGAGKTTLINSICGIVDFTSGSIRVFDLDTRQDYRDVRSIIGLVPQELTTDAFETVWNTVSFSRELFGHAPNPGIIEETLRRLSLWDKRNEQLRALSGGMKRRVMIAKALSHEPLVLFLDEPTAGVDVELRKSMWSQISELRQTGVTIILTTHYIEEAEKMADRVGVINQGELMLIEEKYTLMHKLGKKTLSITLAEPLNSIPQALDGFTLGLSNDGRELVFHFDEFDAPKGADKLLELLYREKISCSDMAMRQSTLEEIFVELLNNPHAS